MTIIMLLGRRKQFCNIHLSSLIAFNRLRALVTAKFKMCPLWRLYALLPQRAMKCSVIAIIDDTSYIPSLGNSFFSCMLRGGTDQSQLC